MAWGARNLISTQVRARNGIGESRPERYHVLEHAAELDARPVLYRIDAERGTGEDPGCLGGRRFVERPDGGFGELAPS